MNKLMCLALCALMMLPFLPAMAEDVDTSLPGMSTVLDGDTFYTLTAGGPRGAGPRKVWRWTPGDAQPTLFATVPGWPEDMPYNTAFEDHTDQVQAGIRDMVHMLYVDAGQLMAMNYYTGKLGTVDADGVHWTEQAVDTSPYFKGGNLQVYNAGFLHDGKLFFILDEYDMENDLSFLTLLVSDPQTGTTVTLNPAEPIQAVAPYTPGKLLALRAVRNRDSQLTWQMAEMGASTGALTPLPMDMGEASPDTANSVGAIGYDERTDTYFYATSAKLMMSQQKKPFVVTALLPFDYMMPGVSRGFPMADGRWVVFMGGTLAVRDTGGMVDLSRSLTIQGSGMFDDVKTAFQKAHPDVALFYGGGYMTAADAAERVRNGDTETDLFYVRANAALRAMIDKEYAAPLTSEKLIADVATLYPVIQSVILDAQGNPRAYPSAFHHSTGSL